MRALHAALAASIAFAPCAALAGDPGARPGQPELPTYEGGYDGFGRFGNDHGYRGFGRDDRYRGGTTPWSDRSLSVPAGALGLAYGLSMGPYQGSFVESYGYPDGGGRSRPTDPGRAPLP